jgi:NADPH:quinone reductase-like Zn-dependent oxidoreductase
MKAIRVHEYGGPAVLKLEEIPDPKPGPGDVVVRVRAAGVNPVDAYMHTGTYVRKPPLPYTPGQDGAGEIQSIGANVKTFTVGDRVYITGVGNTAAGAGTYAELALCAPSPCALRRSSIVCPRPRRSGRARRSACRTARRTAHCSSARARGRAKPCSCMGRPEASASRPSSSRTHAA